MHVEPGSVILEIKYGPGKAASVFYGPFVDFMESRVDIMNDDQVAKILISNEHAVLPLFPTSGEYYNGAKTVVEGVCEFRVKTATVPASISNGQVLHSYQIIVKCVQINPRIKTAQLVLRRSQKRR
jgi:hypothetical protein